MKRKGSRFMINPDIAFAKIRSGKIPAKKLRNDVETWEFSDEPDKLNAWCLLFLHNKTYTKRVIVRLASVLSSNDPKATPNALLVLMYAPNEMLVSPRIKKATRFAFLNGSPSTRINAVRILAAQKDLGDSAAKKLLVEAKIDPDPRVRDNAAILARKAS